MNTEVLKFPNVDAATNHLGRIGFSPKEPYYSRTPEFVTRKKYAWVAIKDGQRDEPVTVYIETRKRR